MELTLDTKENCFLCLQRIPESEKNELRLKNICRFLQINIADVLLEGMKDGEGDNDAFNYNLLQNIKCNFSVNLCNPCYGITGKLSSIIHDLEVAKLQVNYYAEVFQKILEKADFTFAASKKTDNSETADSRMVDHLRKKAKQKCISRNRMVLATTSRLPLLRLNRLTNETVTTMSRKCNIASIIPTSASAVNDAGFDISHSNNSTLKCEYPESMGNVDAPIFPRVLVGALSSPGSKDDGSEDIKRCTKLNILEENSLPTTVSRISNSETGIITAPQGTQGNNSRAMTAGTCENTFPQLKSSEDCQLMSCSESLNPDLDPVVEQVVPEDWINCQNNQVPKESQILKDPLSCDDWADDGITVETKICTKSFTMQPVMQEERRMVKKRKIDDENTKARGPLNRVAAERKTVNKRNQDPKSCKGRYACYHCKGRFAHHVKLHLHMTSYHPEQIFLAYKPAYMSATEFADPCRKVLQKETVAYSSKKAILRQCSYCTESQRYKPHYLRHLVYSHTKLIGEKIKRFANKESQHIGLIEYPLSGGASKELQVETENCTASRTYELKLENGESQPIYVFAEKVKTNHIRNKFKAEGPSHCDRCKTRFARPENLRLHLIRAHPEQIFLSVKPSHRSESEFAESCREVFQRETAGYSDYKKARPEPQECAYCTKVQRYKQDYLRHLVYCHTRIMREKIRAFENEEAQARATAFPSSSNFYRAQSLDSGESSLINLDGSDNHSYPVVARVEGLDQINTSPKVTCEEVLTGGDWNDVQVEDTMIKTEDYKYNRSSIERVPILVDPLSIDEFNNCITTDANTIPISLSETTDVKYLADNGV